MSQRYKQVRAVCVAALVALISGGSVLPAAASTGSGGDGDGRHGCVRPESAVGDTIIDVSFGGATYPVLVYVPAGVSQHRALPLVLNLHGSGANGFIQMDISELRAVADSEKFIVAAPSGNIALPPQATPDPNGSWAWNVPGVPTTAGAFPPPTARDDVAFLSRVIDVVSDSLCTSDRRTYATGFSGGARMVSALACRIPSQLAAIAPVAGVRAGRPDPQNPTVPEAADCTPEREVAVIAFHGQVDPVNPYQGRPTDLRWGYSVPLAVQTWAELNGCRPTGKTTTISEHVTRLRYKNCDGGSDVELYTVSDGGHTWPGTSVPAPVGAPPTQEIEAAQLIWDFFKKHHG